MKGNDIFQKLTDILEMQAVLLNELSQLLRALQKEFGNQEQKYYSVSEAAKLMSISESALRRLIKAGKIPSLRLGGKILIPASTLEFLSKGDNRFGSRQ